MAGEMTPDQAKQQLRQAAERIDADIASTLSEAPGWTLGAALALGLLLGMYPKSTGAFAQTLLAVLLPEKR